MNIEEEEHKDEGLDTKKDELTEKERDFIVKQRLNYVQDLIKDFKDYNQ